MLALKPCFKGDKIKPEFSFVKTYFALKVVYKIVTECNNCQLRVRIVFFLTVEIRIEDDGVADCNENLCRRYN